MATTPPESRLYAAILIADDHSDIHAANMAWWLCRIDGDPRAGSRTHVRRLVELLPVPPIYTDNAERLPRLIRVVQAETSADIVKAAARWLVHMGLAATAENVRQTPTDRLPGDLPYVGGSGVAVVALDVAPYRAEIQLVELIECGVHSVLAWTPTLCHGTPVGGLMSPLSVTIAPTSCRICGWEWNPPAAAFRHVTEGVTVAMAAVTAFSEVCEQVEQWTFPTVAVPTWRYGDVPAGYPTAGTSALAPNHHDGGTA